MTARAAEGRSPFVRLAELLADVAPGKPAINLSVGEPQHPIPPFVGPVIAAHLNDFGRYPANKGTESFRTAAARWLGWRYALARPLDVENEVLVLSGTREGLFLAAIAAKRTVAPRAGRPAILIPNPFYAAYGAGAAAAECEPVYLAATAANGFLPDLDGLDGELLARTVAFYLASPANPQGSVADIAYLRRLAGLAQRFGFLVFNDECYSEIYSGTPPAGMLEAAGPDFANVVSFHSMSKRSNLPGLRVGFAAGDRSFVPEIPGPAQRLRLRRCRPRCRRWQSPPTRMKPMSRPTASSMWRNSTWPIRSSQTVTGTGVPPAGFSSGSTWPPRAAARRWRCACGARPA